jgi:uncharacterized protein YdhG (YjbR/CyaY superfamily)
MADKKNAAKRTDVAERGKKVFTADERAAMQERARELKAESRATASRADGERDLLAKIAEMPASDRAMATRLHALITTVAPELAPKTWYGMPAWTKDGKLVCFFKAAAKFDQRYATFGFEENAKLDDGAMWATSWALTKLTPADEKKIGALVKRAVS